MRTFGQPRRWLPWITAIWGIQAVCAQPPLPAGTSEERFARFDWNGDDKVTEREVPADLRRRLRNLDADNDGTITALEFQEEHKRRPPIQPPTSKPSRGRGGPPRLRPAEDRNQIYDGQEAFLKQDLDGDRAVSA